MSRTTAIAFAVAVAAPLVLGSCSGPERSPSLDTENGRVFVGNVNDWLHNKDISERQRTILEKATHTGQISFEDYQAVTDDALTCMRKSDIPVTGPTVGSSRGIPYISYSHGTPPGMTDDQALALADACLNKYSFAVQMLWDSVPTNIEQREKAFAAYRPAIVECLASEGLETAPDATLEEIERAAMQHLIKSAEASGTPEKNCLQEWNGG